VAKASATFILMLRKSPTFHSHVSKVADFPFSCFESRRKKPRDPIGRNFTIRKNGLKLTYNRGLILIHFVEDLKNRREVLSVCNEKPIVLLEKTEM
jgi:hypothetical protein